MDRDRIFAVLDAFHQRRGIATVIHGAARGADTIAGDWAMRQDKIDVLACPADWDRHKKAAGFKRNQAMLRLKPDLVVAFPGGSGTRDMINRAEVAGIVVAKFAEQFD